MAGTDKSENEDISEEVSNNVDKLWARTNQKGLTLDVILI
jgi:hypothetical protein